MYFLIDLAPKSNWLNRYINGTRSNVAIELTKVDFSATELQYQQVTDGGFNLNQRGFN